MIDTIFSPSFGNRPSYLVGREAVVTRLVDGLQSPPGARERSVVLLGQRGSGKTVLLWELAIEQSSLDMLSLPQRSRPMACSKESSRRFKTLEPST